MLPLQFFGQNIHFVISLFAALVFFAVFWLYFDAWLAKRKAREIFKWAGFLFLSVSFVIYGTVINQSVSGQSFLGTVSEAVSQILRLIGYISILVSEIIDPIQKKPEVTEMSPELLNKDLSKNQIIVERKVVSQSTKAPGLFGWTVVPLHIFQPLAVFAVSAMFWRRATTGLERHLKPIAIAFFFLTGFEVCSLANLWSNTSNPSIAKLAATFGPIWIVAHLLLAIATLVLGKWVWQYLTKRFMSQLFMVFVSMALGIFLVTTVSFSYLLVNSIRKSALSNLNTAASVLNYAINTKKAETVANSQTVAENPAVASAVSSGDHDKLVSLTNSFLSNKKESSLIITNNNAEVLLQAENPAHYGNSLSSDTLIRRALIGENASSVSEESGVLAPTIYIRSATPIRNAQQQIVGATVVSFGIDNAFVDGVKQATGLDSSIYANNIVSATTFLAPDGVSRWTGVKETNKAVVKAVLSNSRPYKGTVDVLNREFLGVYIPLKNIDNTVIGMLFIGEPSSDIVQTANHSIELTFIVTALLLVFSVVPAYLMARYIAKQLE